MDIDIVDSKGLIENEVFLALSKDEVHQLRLALSLSAVLVKTTPATEEFLALTDDI